MNDLRAYGEYSSQVQAADLRKPFVPANHLAGELSPCLRARASDPVGWHSWGEEAFAVARREDRPLFVSVGLYSDHWCHVMNRECFSDREVAGMLNSSCIPVYVDALERPDVDALLMETCRLQHGSAGYPLNVFMTPEGKPFFCATWLPKRTAGQVPGITELLPRMRWLWHMQRRDVGRTERELAEKLSARLSELGGEKGGRIGKIKAYEALNDLRSIFDVRWGGWGGIPKMPEPSKLLFLAHIAKDDSAKEKSYAEAMADVTLRRIWRGGIHDHLGGGVMRSAADERWIVPKFEEELSMQALMLLAVSMMEEVSSNQFHRMFAEDIIFCAMKYFADDTAYSQAFRASVDGDTDDGEGRYYTWSEDEIRRILPETFAGMFCAAYGVLPSGNLKAEIAGSQMGQNILYEASTVTDLAERSGVKAEEVVIRLNECRKILLEARDKRNPLKTDSKILMGWNGLMIGALARASTAFEQSEWKDLAERCALFIQKNLHDRAGEWQRVWIDGKAYIPAQAEDYAYLLWGIVELYKATKHFTTVEKQLDEWKESAQSLADKMIDKLWDEKLGGLFQTDGTDRHLFARIKSAVDANSLPSANAVAAIALSELGIILEEKKYSDYARNIIACFSKCTSADPLGYLSLIVADMMWKPVKKKPAPPPKPVPTDEELNREDEAPEISPPEQTEQEDRRAARARRTAASSTRSERAERRRAGRRRER